ncbi:hypothetical protein [Rhizobacter sp. P5_C2]
MKNIQVIDGAENCVYDIFQASDEEFSLIFSDGRDIAFIDEVYQATDPFKKIYYPSRKDEEAVNPDGSQLR